MEDPMHTRHTSTSAFISGALGSETVSAIDACNEAELYGSWRPAWHQSAANSRAFGGFDVFGVDYAKRGGAKRVIPGK